VDLVQVNTLDGRPAASSLDMQDAPTAPETHQLHDELLRQLFSDVMDSQGDCARAATMRHRATRNRNMVIFDS